MNAGYTPVFGSIYDGTLHGKWPAAALFASLLPLFDRFGVLDISIEALCARTGWPRELLEQGLAQLMSPDPDSRSPDEDGRRLVPLDPNRRWGWRCVNHARYAEKARKRAWNEEYTASGADAERKRAERDAARTPSGDVRTRPADSGSTSSSSSATPKSLEESGKPDPAPLDVGQEEAKRTRKRAELRNQAKAVLAFLNERTSRNYQPVSANLDLICARLREGATEEQLRQVIARRVRKWGADPKMADYLRPKTLFSATNFANYAGELVALPEAHDDAA